MLEREIKQLLTEQEYAAIISSDVWSGLGKKQLLQINYYYDTPNFELFRHDITLRVRQKEGRLNLEMKYSVADKTTYKIKQELSRPLDALPATIDTAAYFPEAPVAVQAALIQPLVTERTSIRFSDGVAVDVDKNSYLGRLDYELEIEFSEDAYDEAYRLYKHFFADRESRTGDGKKGRFFEAYLQFMDKSLDEGDNA
ncbi:CYTH domain-containing protein [Paenibacillus athensensis]|uniref:CYTH domain-containing protein n=1 Tax=Paenibacillus athensensis TaxID=1967502 RepID=UPI0014315BAF|nr:CYTH domain-containing protein [Paenibacillus athensensis]MCD1258641.1 CYTH domain-containing protein [Paenibacillus athensensis]